MQIERVRGDTFTITNRKTRAVVNLTGSTLKLTLNSLQAPEDTTTELYQLSGVITDPETGVVEFSPTSEQSDVVGLYYFDVQMTDSFGQVTTLTSGTYTYKQDITK
jgi:hypothetical protein